MAHHGSLARAERLAAEQKLKRGDLKAIVATASLELGIDVGAVDLVCQVDSPKSISAAIQRIGRSGHTLGGTPKGRFFALTLDDLLECRRGGSRDAPASSRRSRVSLRMSRRRRAANRRDRRRRRRNRDRELLAHPARRTHNFANLGARRIIPSARPNGRATCRNEFRARIPRFSTTASNGRIRAASRRASRRDHLRWHHSREPATMTS